MKLFKIFAKEKKKNNISEYQDLLNKVGKEQFLKLMRRSTNADVFKVYSY